MQHKIIIENIKRIMKEKGITVSELARSSLIPRSELEDYLEGRKKLDSLHKLVRISDALGENVDVTIIAQDKKVELTEQEKNFLLAHKHMTQDQKSILIAFLMGCKHAHE